MDEAYYDADFVRLRIESLREQKGVSAREMSLGLGKNTSYITGIVSGRSLPTFEGFLEICDYLRITPSAFFDFECKDPALYQALASELERLFDHDSEKIKSLLLFLKTMEPRDINSVGRLLDNFQSIQL